MDTAGLCVKCAAYSIVTCGSETTGSEEMLPKNGSPDDVQNPDEGTSGQGDHTGYTAGSPDDVQNPDEGTGGQGDHTGYTAGAKKR